jgi:hypothetical protein
MTVAPYPNHCFHDVSNEQRDEDWRCCFCNIKQREYVKSEHGKYYKGLGELVNFSGQECQSRKSERQVSK